MGTTITAAIDRVKAALDAHFSRKGFEWKTQESQSEHRQAKPTVFALLCAERTADNWPVQCPSVTIEAQEVTVLNDALALNIVCHCAVVNSAIIEREKVIKTDEQFSFLDTDGYSDQGIREALFRDCLLLAEETMNALRTLAGLANIKLTPPASFDDFPYAQSQVTATLGALAQFNDFRSFL